MSIPTVTCDECGRTWRGNNCGHDAAELAGEGPLHELVDALDRYDQARTARSGEAKRLYLDLMAIRDRVRT